jgi:hypothetical protein
MIALSRLPLYALFAVSLASMSGCYAEESESVGYTAPVYQGDAASTVVVNEVPPDIQTVGYRVQYGTGWAYYYGDRWYYYGPGGGWSYFVAEPPLLYRARYGYYNQYYGAPPPVYRAPMRYAPPPAYRASVVGPHYASPAPAYHMPAPAHYSSGSHGAVMHHR